LKDRVVQANMAEEYAPTMALKDGDESMVVREASGIID